MFVKLWLPLKARWDPMFHNLDLDEWQGKVKALEESKFWSLKFPQLILMCSFIVAARRMWNDGHSPFNSPSIKTIELESLSVLLTQACGHLEMGPVNDWICDCVWEFLFKWELSMSNKRRRQGSLEDSRSGSLKFFIQFKRRAFHQPLCDFSVPVKLKLLSCPPGSVYEQVQL